MKDKITEKIEKGLRAAYEQASSVYPRTVTWDEINTPEVAAICKKHKASFWAGFFLPKEKYNQIVKDLTKGSRWSWRWPRRTEIDKNGRIVPDPEWDEYQAAHEVKLQELKDKKITRKEYNAWLNEMGEKYHMQRRNYDREKVDFNIWNYAPNSNAEEWHQIDCAYKEVVLGHTPEEAAKAAVPIVTDDSVEKEYESRLAVAEKYNSPEDFRKTFLDKKEIRESLEASYKNRINVISETVKLLKKLWDEIFSKN